MTSKIKIDINSTKTAFNVVAPFFANELVRELPNRTFDTRAKVWRCSMVRFNAKHIKEHWYSIKEIEWGAGVKEAVERLSSDEPLKREPFPANFRFKTHPFKHQKDALDYLWSLKAAALFSEQGTGKTKVAIDLATARYMLGEIDALVVISPTSVRYEWAKKELPAHFNGMFRTFVLDTSTSGYERRFSDFCTMSPGMPVLLVGYDALSNTASKVGRLVESYLKDRRCMLVLDESHNIKNPAANRTERITDMGEHATYRLVMTGTPSSGSTLDLYAQYQFLDRQIIGIGNYTSFKARYVVMGGYENKQVVGYKNTDELMELVKPYTFQVTKEEALPHLPPKVYQTRYLEMGDKQKKMYQDMRRKRKLEIDKALKSGEPLELVAESVLQTYNMLCQMTDGFVYHETEEPDGVGGVRKIKQTERLVEVKDNVKIKELLDEVAKDNKPVIVWATFQASILAIYCALADVYGKEQVARFDGSCTDDERLVGKERFLSGQARFFVGNPVVGGAGLTLNVANKTIYFGNSFKLIDRLQSEDRNHRIGQESSVLYIDLVCRGTTDEDVLAALKEKKGLTEYIKERLATDKQVLGEDGT